MSDAPDDLSENLPEQMRIRRAKLDRLREAGVDPYPVGYPRTNSIGEIRAKYEGLGCGRGVGERVAVAGRVMLYRTSGKLCFATIRDDSAAIQVMLSLDQVGRAFPAIAAPSAWITLSNRRSELLGGEPGGTVPSDPDQVQPLPGTQHESRSAVVIG